MNNEPNNSSFGRFLYALLFVVLLPALLVAWARLADPVISLPVPDSLWVGVGAALAGLIIMVAGIVSIMIYGDGLPMNAYPPRRYVSRWIYRYVSHPIYLGFCLLCIGVSILCKSSGGIWLVSPAVILGCTALVQGFEKHDLRRRFGDRLPKPFISLPEDELRRPTLGNRLSVYCVVFIPWAALYGAVKVLGIPSDAMVVWLPLERGLPVYSWTAIFYASAYFAVLFYPLIANSAKLLRSFAVAGIAATATIIFLMVLVPCAVSAKAWVSQVSTPISTNVFGDLLAFWREYEKGAPAFPSFIVAGAILAASAYTAQQRSLRAFWWSWAALVSASAVTSGMHTILDVLGGILVALSILNRGWIWARIRGLAQNLANSWKERQIGPIRIINHGKYAALGSMFGFFIVGSLLGEKYVGAALIVTFAALIGAGLWAQYIEGSSSLLRPYGYYGGLLGGILGCMGAGFALDFNIWLLLGAFSVAAPWIQAAGRLRCLVQGCCHGRKAQAMVGICYNHPRSRVCKIAGLTNVPIHPTPLYSILWNIPVGLVLARLWSLEASPALIAGLYLMLNSLGRFVEESYRGEPQTPIIGRLRLYQPVAIVGIIAGAVLTVMPTYVSLPTLHIGWRTLSGAVCVGFIIWLALGVDFPNSNRRFSRLV